MRGREREQLKLQKVVKTRAQTALGETHRHGEFHIL